MSHYKTEFGYLCSVLNSFKASREVIKSDLDIIVTNSQNIEFGSPAHLPTNLNLFQQNIQKN